MPIAIAIAAAIFLIGPIIVVVMMGFSNSPAMQFPPTGFGVGYFIRYFSSPDWIHATVNSFVIALITSVVTLALVIPAAIAYTRRVIAGKAAFDALMMLPLIAPQIVVAVAYFGLLSFIGLSGTIAGVVIAHVCLAIPISFLVVSAAFRRLDRNLERAAMSLGARPLRTFFFVTLPVMRSGILVGALFAFLASFNESVVALFISGRDAGTLPKRMFESIRMESDPVLAAVATLLTSFVFVGVIVSSFMRRNK
ncbi:MAG: ABC transporter permease [Pseudorhodoplanes sp.]